MNQSETWLPVVGYEGIYEVSDFGGVRRLRGFGALESRILTGTVSHGYRIVALSWHSKIKMARVHRLVAEAFLTGERGGENVCHGDGDPLNNRVTNLRWDNQSGNMKDALKHGTHQSVGQTCCKRGHEFTDENTYMHSGRRFCRSCARVRKEIRQLSIQNEGA